MIELRQLFQCMGAVQMREKFYNGIEKGLSSSRLSTYQNHSHNADITIANYVLNAKLSEKFYFLLQNLEVTLRNAIYNGFKKHYPTSDFSTFMKQIHAIDTFQSVKNILVNVGKCFVVQNIA